MAVGVRLSDLPRVGGSSGGVRLGDLARQTRPQSVSPTRRVGGRIVAPRWESRGQPSAAGFIREQAAKRTDRPKTFLNQITRVITAIPNSIIGFVGEYQKVMHEEKVGMSEPWEFFKAIGAGFREVPHAVANERSGPERILEQGPLSRVDPDSFLGRHRDTIALTLAAVADPTIYLTFGATTPAKLAAMRTLDHAQKTSMEAAVKAMERGGKVTMEGQTRQFHNVEEAFEFIHISNGRPLTMGDALDDIRKVSRVEKQAARRGQRGVKRAISAYTIPAPRGGRGVRFMGMPVPGSPEATAYISKVVRGQLKDVHGTRAYKMLTGFMPNAYLHHVANDAIRAGLWSSFTNYRRTGRQAKAIASETAKDLLQAEGRKGLIRSGDWPGLHRLNPSQVVRPEVRAVRDRIESVRVRLANEALKTGMKQKQIDNLWDNIANRIDDPIEAAAEFTFRMETRTHSRRFTQQILKDPRFAKAITSEAGRLPGDDIFRSEGKMYSVRESVHEALETVSPQAFIDWETSRFLRAINFPQQKWKIMATVVNPSFHFMNSVGAMFNNALALVINPLDYTAAVGAIVRDRLGKTPDIVSQARARGQLARESFIAVETKTERPGQLAKEIEQKEFRPSLHDPRRIIDRGALSKKRFAARRGRQLAAVGLAPVNPLSLLMLLPEAAAAGRATSGIIEDVVRLAPFKKAANDPVTRQVLEMYGPITIHGAVHPGWTKRQQEAMYDIGADLSAHFQFDYRDLTEFERRFAKTTFPFYTFFKKNFTLQVEQMARQPRTLAGWNALTTYMNEVSGEELPANFRRILPEYFDNLEAFRIPLPDFARKKLGLPEDEPVYLNPKLPLISLNLFPPFWDLFRETGEPFPTKLMRVTAPITGQIGPLAPVMGLPIPGAKIAFEYMTNKQLGLARPIDYQRANSNDWRQSYRDAPGWVKYLPPQIRGWFGVTETKQGRMLMTSSSIYILDQLSTPFINNLGQSIAPASASEEAVGRARADTVSWLTGVRLMPVDMLKLHRGWGYRLLDMLEGQKQELEDSGRVMDPEDAAALKILRQQMKVIEQSWDEREKSLYGP